MSKRAGRVRIALTEPQAERLLALIDSWLEAEGQWGSVGYKDVTQLAKRLQRMVSAEIRRVQEVRARDEKFKDQLRRARLSFGIKKVQD